MGGREERGGEEGKERGKAKNIEWCAHRWGVVWSYRAAGLSSTLLPPLRLSSSSLPLPFLLAQLPSLRTPPGVPRAASMARVSEVREAVKSA